MSRHHHDDDDEVDDEVDEVDEVEEEEEEAGPFVVFGSNAAAPLRTLSNLADTPFGIRWSNEAALYEAIPPHMRGRCAAYPTVEHAFQALRSLDAHTARAFELAGSLHVRLYLPQSRETEAASVLSAFPKKAKASKFAFVNLHAKMAAYWGRRACSGIVAKMVS